MRKGNISDTDPMVSAGINPDLAKNPYVPGSRYQTVRSEFYLSTIPNSGVFRPKEAKGRADWLFLLGKAFQARGDLTADQRKFATGANIQVQGLRDEVQQLKKELQSLRNPRQPGLYGYPQYQYGQYRLINNRHILHHNKEHIPTTLHHLHMDIKYHLNSIIQFKNHKLNNLSLKSLEKMRERGLISEENYLKKLKELGY